MWKLASGAFLGWSLGANDSANIFGTGVATGTVKYGTAIWLTAGLVIPSLSAISRATLVTTSSSSTVSVS